MPGLWYWLSFCQFLLPVLLFLQHISLSTMASTVRHFNRRWPTFYSHVSTCHFMPSRVSHFSPKKCNSNIRTKTTARADKRNMVAIRVAWIDWFWSKLLCRNGISTHIGYLSSGEERSLNHYFINCPRCSTLRQSSLCWFYLTSFWSAVFQNYTCFSFCWFSAGWD